MSDGHGAATKSQKEELGSLVLKNSPLMRITLFAETQKEELGSIVFSPSMLVGLDSHKQKEELGSMVFSLLTSILSTHSHKEESESQKQKEESKLESQKQKEELEESKLESQKQKMKLEFESQKQKKDPPSLSWSDHVLPMPLDPLNDPGQHWKKRSFGRYMLPNLEPFHSKKTRINIGDDGWHYNFLKTGYIPPPCRICSSDHHGHNDCPYKRQLPPGAENHIDTDFCVILCSCGQNVSQDGDCPESCVGARYVMERSRKKFFDEAVDRFFESATEKDGVR